MHKLKDSPIAPMSPCPLIDISDISLTFGGTSDRSALTVLKNVSLSVEAGTFICIIGPSGCGKSSLLSVLAGYLKPTDGKVTIGGRDLTGPAPNRVMVFQNPTLFPWGTARANVAFGLKLKVNRGKVADIDRTVDELLALVGLEGFGDHYPYELSGGMRQRVEIARALAVDPEVLLMDEPFGALDALTRIAMQREMLRIWERTKKTVLFVTHDIDEAVILSDQVVVMSHRPASVKEIIPITLPRPRHRDSDEVGRISSHIANLLDVSL